MKIYSLVAVRWDEQESLFYPIGCEHSVNTFLAGGFLAFTKRFWSDAKKDVTVLHCISTMEGSLVTGTKVYGPNDVLTLTHQLAEYLAAELAKYCERDLPHDLARESM